MTGTVRRTDTTEPVNYEVVWGLAHDQRTRWVDYGDGSTVSEHAEALATRSFLDLSKHGRKAGFFVNGVHKAGHDFAEEWTAYEREAAHSDAEWAAYQDGARPAADGSIRYADAPQRHVDLSRSVTCPNWGGWAVKAQTAEVIRHTPAAFDMKPYPAWARLTGRFWILAEVIAVTDAAATLRYLTRANTKAEATVMRPPALKLPKPQPHKITYSAGSEVVGNHIAMDGARVDDHGYFFRAWCSCGGFSYCDVDRGARRWAVKSHLAAT